MNFPKLDGNSFDQKVYDDEESCLVIFSRKDCHVCKEVVPMLEDFAESYEDKSIKFYSVDIEEQVLLYERFSLKGVPSILFFNGGEYQGKLAGKVEEEHILKKIKTLG